MSQDSRGARPVPPASVVVAGAGTMGAGMALTFAAAGSRVALLARRAQTIDRARRRIEESVERLIEGGVVTPSDRAHVLGRIVSTTRMPDVDFDVDLVVESIPEDPAAKRELFRAVEDAASERTVLATNTSSLSLCELSEGLHRPERFLGYHWFNPPELVALVEVVCGPRTDPAVADRVESWSRAIGKEPVRVTRDVEGFVANRLQYALIREAYNLVADGVCSAEDVDRVVTSGLGPRWAAVGPFETMDLAGLDVHRAVVERLFPTLAADRAVPDRLRELVDSGALGAKSGRGLRGEYDEDSLARLDERRARVLLALQRLRRGD